MIHHTSITNPDPDSVYLVSMMKNGIIDNNVKMPSFFRKCNIILYHLKYNCVELVAYE